MRSMEQLKYRLIRSKRKTLAIQISPDGEVIVRAPMKMPASEIRRFVDGKQSWIEKHLPDRTAILPKLTEEELRALAKQAQKIIPARVKLFAPQIGVTYGRITIRSQRTRWGSCSSKGNLNFNCLLMLTNDDVIDYVVVHELCHRKEMNHSPKFWALVEQILPEYRKSKRWLKDHGGKLIGRLN